MIYDRELEYKKYVLQPVRTNIEKIFGVGTGITHSMITNVQLPGAVDDYHIVVYLERDDYRIKNLILKYASPEFPITFEVIGKLVPLHFEGRYRPVKAGVTINNGNSTRCSSGTLTCFAKDSQGRDVLISNNHVIALNFSDSASYTGKKGDAIIQPSCGNGGHIATDRIASLEYSVAIQNGTGGNNKIDAGYAMVDPGVDIDTYLNACNWQIKPSIDPVIGMSIKKAGRTTGCTTGSITAVDVTGNVDYSGMGSSYAHFVDQFAANISLGGGDSGSLIQTASGEAVGLLFTGSIFNKIKNVEQLLNVTIGGSIPICGTPTVYLHI